MKKIFTFLTVLLFTTAMFAQEAELPIDFESSTILYTFSDFEGGVGSVIDNPQSSGINTSAKVGQMIKFDGQVFGGSTLALAGPIDFGDNNAIKMKVFANRVDAPVLFKLEGAAPVEVSAKTTVANEWEELTFSFAGLTGSQYTAITIIYDLGTIGDGSADFTLLFDDIELTTSTGGGVQLPVDFESTELTYIFADFGGGVASIVDNPMSAGINTSAKVGQMIKFEGEVFGGSTLSLGGPIDFGSNNAVKMKVLANRVGANVLFKLEGPAPVEVNMPTTVANEWEELTYSFAGLTGGVYTGITIIYDLGIVGDGGADFTMFFDDMELTTDMAGGVQLPVDFESMDLTYTFSDFGGGVASVIDNPMSAGINTSAKVGQMIKFEGEVFGGSTLALGGPIDFGSNNAITMKVLANRVGANVLFKLEGPAPVEVNIPTTVANEWEELTFSFAGLTGGVYTGITIIYDLGVVGDGGADFTMFFDDMALTTQMAGGVQLPVDFESTDLTYTFSDFGGGVGSIIDNPMPAGINTSAKVGQYIKFAGEVFGGTTLALGGPIDFGANTSISMKVLASRVGGAVLLKLEGPAPVEKIVNSTVANEWEEMVFDFTGMTAGVYTGITLIYDIGVVGDGSPNFTFAFDDIQFPGTSAVVDLSELGVEYFPNPVVDNFTLKADDQIDQVNIYNINGQLLLSTRPKNNVVYMDLSTLVSGLYFAKIQIGNNQATAKIIKE